MLGKVFYRRAGGWIVTLCLVYGVFIGALFLMQKSLMYFPDPNRFSPADWALKELEPIAVSAQEGLVTTSWYIPPRKKTKFTVVFFQGNLAHLGYRNYKVRPWMDEGYGVVMVGYRGFSNPGVPSEQGLYADARATLDAINKKGVPDKAMVFYGESMGTGVATQMATERQAAALILESPYTSVPDVGADRYPMVPVRLLLRDKYDSLSKIASVHMPLLLLHGEQDTVVPVKFGKKLFAAANEPKQAVYVPKAGHNDVYNAEVQQVILSYLAKIPTDSLLEVTPSGK